MSSGTENENATASRILDIIAREGMVEEAKLNRDATLEDLEIASIDMVMILQGLEEEFDIYIPMGEEIMELQNVGDVIDTVTRLIEEKNNAPA